MVKTEYRLFRTTCYNCGKRILKEIAKKLLLKGVQQDICPDCHGKIKIIIIKGVNNGEKRQ